MTFDFAAARDLLNQAQQASQSAAQYGPFFFAILFLFCVPIVITFLYKRIFDSTPDLDIRRSLAQDFRLYFRSTMAVGIISTLLGAFWWIWSSYSYSEKTKMVVDQLRLTIADLEGKLSAAQYVIVGRVDLEETNLIFENKFYDPQIYFTKSPFGMKSWVFVILSKSPLSNETLYDIPLFKKGDNSSSIPENVKARLQLGTPTPFRSYKVEQTGAYMTIRPQD